MLLSHTDVSLCLLSPFLSLPNQYTYPWVRINIFININI